MPAHRSAGLSRIIGLLMSALVLSALLVLGGCSTTRLGYEQAPRLLTWWLDGYLDLGSAQTAQVRQQLQGVHDWHRRQELPAYVALLRQMQALGAAPVSAPQVCALVEPLRAAAQRLAVQTGPLAASLLPTLTPAQQQHLAAQLDKRDREWREEWLDGTPAERLERRLKKARERAEDFYGRLSDAQRNLLRQRLAESTLDIELSWRERQRRQQDLLALVREHAGSSRASHVQAEWLAWWQRSLDSPDAAYRAQLARLQTEACENLAELHNLATPSQRQRLVAKVQGYEVDLRALMPTP